jgi:hypothetical protein
LLAGSRKKENKPEQTSKMTRLQFKKRQILDKYHMRV